MSASRVSGMVAAALALAATVAASVQARPPARSAAGAPSVQSMIVGATGAIVSPARSVTTGASTVRVGARSCAVGAGTPLAVLAALSRAGGPAFALRDYGRCNSSPRNSGQLFVYSLAARPTAARTAGSTRSTACPARPARAIRAAHAATAGCSSSGARVLWFWCQAVAGGCQRTLEVSRRDEHRLAGRAAERARQRLRQRRPRGACRAGDRDARHRLRLHRRRWEGFADRPVRAPGATR